MGTKYRELMERVSVTPELRARVLEGVRTETAKVRSRAAAWKFAASAACLAVLLIGAAVLSSQPFAPPPSGGGSSGGPDFQACASAQALSDAVGFPVSDVTGLPFTPTETVYTAYDDEMAQVSYWGDEQSAFFRKGRGDQDISGDYTDYPQTFTLEAEDASVTLRGQSDGYTLAVWTRGDFSYSLTLSQPLSVQDWTELILSIP